MWLHAGLGSYDSYLTEPDTLTGRGKAGTAWSNLFFTLLSLGDVLGKVFTTSNRHRQMLHMVRPMYHLDTDWFIHAITTPCGML